MKESLLKFLVLGLYGDVPWSRGTSPEKQHEAGNPSWSPVCYLCSVSSEG